eukprot:gene40855-50883_t
MLPAGSSGRTVCAPPQATMLLPPLPLPAAPSLLAAMPAPAV